MAHGMMIPAGGTTKGSVLDPSFSVPDAKRGDVNKGRSHGGVQASVELLYHGGFP